jgi:hypothetical protein
VEQARASYGRFVNVMAQATDIWMAAMPANEMTSGLKVVQERATRFAKQNAEACFALAGELANAKGTRTRSPSRAALFRRKNLADCPESLWNGAGASVHQADRISAHPWFSVLKRARIPNCSSKGPERKRGPFPKKRAMRYLERYLKAGWSIDLVG